MGITNYTVTVRLAGTSNSLGGYGINGMESDDGNGPVGGKCIFTFENLSLIFKGNGNGSDTCAQIAGDVFVSEAGVPLCYVEATTLDKDEQLKVLLKALIAAIVICFHKHKDSYDGNRVLELEDKADIKALLISLLEEKLELDLETSL